MAQYSPESMNTDRIGLKKMTRGELKDVAVSYGLYNGYHERPISKMRKADYIDYILESLSTPVGSPSEPNIPSAPIQLPPPRPSRPRGRNSGGRNSSGGDLLIRLIPPFNFSESPTAETSAPERARRRLDFEEDFGSLLNFAIILHDATTRNNLPEGREFTGQFPTVEEEPEQAHESVRCAVCLHNKICVLFQKCKHVVTCGPCGVKVSRCPICKNPIEHEEKVRVFLP
jgi:hypothetical protein